MATEWSLNDIDNRTLLHGQHKQQQPQRPKMFYSVAFDARGRVLPDEGSAATGGVRREDSNGNMHSQGVLGSRGQRILSSVASWARSSFLPVGYPHSVKPDYLEYQIYDSIQALCSYLRGVMCTHALLQGAGVGSASASALAAALQWILRDGVGMLTSVLFAVRYATYFGEYVKEWRLFADVINDVGLLLDMVSALVPPEAYVYVLCCSAVCKALCGVAAGTTKLCVTNHFCLRNNASDVSAKEGTQETAVTLVGLISGMLITTLFDSNRTFAWISFIVLTALHVYANFKAVRSLNFSTVNRSRLWLLTARFASSQLSGGSDAPRQSCSVKDINSSENLINSYFIATRGPSVGERLSDVLKKISCTATVTPLMKWKMLNTYFGDRMYCVVPIRGGTFSVVMRNGATKLDEVRGYFHAAMLQMTHAIASDNSTPRPAFVSEDDIRKSVMNSSKQWDSFLSILKQEGWDLSDSGVLVNTASWVFDSDKNL